MPTIIHSAHIADSRQRPRLSVVFSFWNEAEVIPELIARTRKTLDGEKSLSHLASYELIFVNDASTDDSQAVLERLAVGRDDLRIITTSRQFGVTPCVLAGMEHAAGDAVIYMDADLQDPPETIPQLLAAWREQPDAEVVHTVRLSRDGESRFKLLLTQIGYRVLRAVSSVDLPIEAGDFKLLSRRAVDQIVECREHRPYMRGLVGWVGFRQITVPYHREMRRLGETKFPVLSRKVISNFFQSALISFSDAPLKLVAFSGLFCLLAALACLTWIVARMFLGHTPSGNSAIITTVLFVGGMNLVGLGILGLYLHSIFIDAKRRPNYVVKELLGFARNASEPANGTRHSVARGHSVAD